MRFAVALIGLALSFVYPAHAAQWVVEAHYADSASLARAAVNFQHVRVNADRQVLVVDTDERGMALLQQAGLQVRINQAATARLRTAYARITIARRSGEPQRSARGYPGIPGYTCYRTVEGTYQTMDDLVAAYPGTVEIDDIGPSWMKSRNPSSGYEMRALRITNLATAPAHPERPVMVIFSSIHAREYAPAEINTRFAEWLVANYGSDPEATWLVDHNDFRLVLQANPDGRKQAEQGLFWRKNVNSIDGHCADSNRVGVDLNRNFPFHWDITNGNGSSGNTCSDTFRGPVKASEPESENLVTYVAGNCNATGECTDGVFADRRDGPMNPPSTSADGGDAAPADTRGMFIDLHSAAELVLWSWGDTFAPAPNVDALRTFGRRLAWFNGYVPEQAATLYVTDGATDDHTYGLLGVAAFTVETDVSFFEGCAAFEGVTWPENLAMLRYAARNLAAPYRLPSGPDTTAVSATPDLVAAGHPVMVTATVDDSRLNQSTVGDPVTEPVQDIGAAYAYIGVLPWAPGAAANPLSPLDGSLDSAVEQVTGSVATAGLEDGRYLIYVQGVDAGSRRGGVGSAGAPGTPNAAFVDVAAASHIGNLHGTVTGADDGLPVSATVLVVNPLTGESRSATSSSVDGSYERSMLVGTVDVQASAAGYISSVASNIVLSGGADVLQDFALWPEVIFADGFEAK